MILIGQQKAAMFNHKDVLRAASWQVQLEGRKRWHVCSSSDDKYIGPPGLVDAFKPDYRSFPRFRNVRTCMQAILYPGDLIYYPKDYWHQTENLDTPSTALSSSTVSRDCYNEVAVELRKECDCVNANATTKCRMIPFKRSTCDKLMSCFATWSNIYGDTSDSGASSSSSSSSSSSLEISEREGKTERDSPSRLSSEKLADREL